MLLKVIPSTYDPIGILSPMVIPSIYDPIGILSPIVVLFKILFKKISLLKCDQDVILEPNLVSGQKKFILFIKKAWHSQFPDIIFRSSIIFIFKISKL